MIACYAVIPDGHDLPTALFMDFEAAMEWAMSKYGDDAFRVRYLQVAQVETSDSPDPRQPN